MPPSDDLPRSTATAADNALPPVEPPSAGFIVQLFVVPMVIVLIIVAVYLMFNWLAQMGSDPTKHIAQIKRGGPASWQAAHDLATELRRDEKLRKNPQVAQELAALLEHELTVGGLENDPVNLRIFLCRSLGEFDGPEGLPALLRAVEAQSDQDQATPVRRAAIESIAVLAAKLRDPAIGGDHSPEETAKQLAQISARLEKASHDDDATVQSTAAFALGVVGDETARNRLRALQSAHPDVRFNAATGLARWGDVACVTVLEEMLDQQQLVAATSEQQESSRPFMQAQVVVNGLRATTQLATANRDADLSALQPALEKLRASQPNPSVQVELEKASQALSAQHTPQPQ